MKKLIFFIIMLVFNMTFFKAYSQKINIVSSLQNISGNSVYINHPSCNDKPEAVIIVETPSFWQYNQATHLYSDPSISNLFFSTHSNIGVWYDNAKKQWAIFNQNKSAMSTGITFKTTIHQTNDSVFTITASERNTYNGQLIINNPILNSNSAASLLITQNWNPNQATTGIYNGEIQSEYNAALQQWLISNRNGSPIINGVAVNIMIKPLPSSNNFSINSVMHTDNIPIILPRTNPLSNHRFRLVCEGFAVQIATSDNIFESDGPGDEMFFTFNVFEFSNGFSYGDVNPLQYFLNSATNKYELKTQIHGTSRIGWPVGVPTGFVKAGTASNIGGLKAYDQFLPAGSLSGNMLNAVVPFNRSNPQSFPLIVWEGSLTEASQIIVLTCPWEWDGDLASSSHTPNFYTAVENNWSTIAAFSAYNYSRYHFSMDYQDPANFWLPQGKQSIASVYDYINSPDNLTFEVDDKFPYWKDKSGTQPFRIDIPTPRAGPYSYYKQNRTIAETRPDIAPLLINLNAIDSIGNPVIGNVVGKHQRVDQNKFYCWFGNDGNGTGVYKVYFRFEKLN